MFEPLLLNPEQAAVVLGVSYDTLRDRTDIPYLVIGRSRRYSVRDLEDWVAAQRRHGDAAAVARSATVPSEPSAVRPITNPRRRKTA